MKKKGKKDEKDEACYTGEGSKGGKKKTDKICHNCKKKGHFKADCWVKGGGKEGQGLKGKKAEASGGEKGTGASVAEAKEEKEDGVWAVVSGDSLLTQPLTLAHSTLPCISDNSDPFSVTLCHTLSHSVTLCHTLSHSVILRHTP